MLSIRTRELTATSGQGTSEDFTPVTSAWGNLEPTRPVRNLDGKIAAEFGAITHKATIRSNSLIKSGQWVEFQGRYFEIKLLQSGQGERGRFQILMLAEKRDV